LQNFLMASDAVTAGHPDKLCDQISDAVVDGVLATGARHGVAAECAIASGVVFLAVRTGAPVPVDPSAVARRVIAECGYPSDDLSVVLEMSEDARLSAEALVREPPHRMATAFGYACDHNDRAMPAPIATAQRLVARLDDLRRGGMLDWMTPDAHAQVAVRFEDRRPVAVPAVALTVGTHEPLGAETVAASLREQVIEPVLADLGLALEADARVETVAHPGVAGPAAHAGLTGRKTAEDTYGGFVRHSGSALSGKDPSRIDRVANYAARHAARMVVAAGLAQECEVQLTFSLGDVGPSDLQVDTHGTGVVPESEISRRLSRGLAFDLHAIQERFGLWALPETHDGSFYRKLSIYGHMGRSDLGAPWEDVGDVSWLTT
jgi:S-adenosylmethionine synthetase